MSTFYIISCVLLLISPVTAALMASILGGFIGDALDNHMVWYTIFAAINVEIIPVLSYIFQINFIGSQQNHKKHRLVFAIASLISFDLSIVLMLNEIDYVFRASDSFFDILRQIGLIIIFVCLPTFLMIYMGYGIAKLISVIKKANNKKSNFIQKITIICAHSVLWSLSAVIIYYILTFSEKCIRILS